jgi:hypothetical protein
VAWGPLCLCEIILVSRIDNGKKDHHIQKELWANGHLFIKDRLFIDHENINRSMNKFKPFSI